MRTRLLAALAATALLATACGSDDNAGDTNTLEMWTFKQAHVEPLKAAAAEFEAETGITVNITAYTPDDVFKSKLQTSAQSSDLADVFEVHAAGEDFVLGGSGILADFDSDVDDAWRGQFVAGVADSGKVDEARYQRSLKPEAPDAGIKTGQRFSVPFTIGTFGVIYANKSVLTAAGLDPTKTPKTWGEFISWLQATHAKDAQNGGLTVGLKSPTTGFNWLLEPLAYGYLGKDGYQALFSDDKSKAWGSQNGQKVLDLYNQLTPYWMPGTQTLSIDDADRAFAEGKAAFDLGGTFTLAAIKQGGMDPNEVVYFGVPPAEGGESSELGLAPLALTGLAISGQTSKNESALKWLKFLTKTDQAAKFAQASLDLPGVELDSDTLGPDLGAMTGVFGSADDGAYDPADVSFFAPAYVDTTAGETLVRMSPLGQADIAKTNSELGSIVATSWQG
ncbi:ABC transporter substrate-binding protein [Actinophytocola oryzae]|uniref:Multiple sugar transport system substrate-binding protein n=1 Tax=Actinophytocola oryzae TaxID=502181 RepID=A0A4R7VAV1_9PSEU|nr:extracellular solute-binding protein [Actinophytocola oryzae]TDV46095.1 multiple sugar transport system substrate-binding protein [Actinophytocola oryzae]